MYRVCLAILIMVGFGCNYHPDKKYASNKKLPTTLVDKPEEIQNKPSSLDNDELIVVFYNDDTIKFSKHRLDLAKKVTPQVNEDIPLSPDKAYYARGKGYQPQNDEEKEFNTFGCEVCQDDYYLMYAYFLKQKNKGEHAKKDRERLISIYRLINSIHSNLQQGGTYFGHQHSRIYAYVEYSVYLRKGDNTYYRKNYSVKAQKSFFTGALRQLILDDEINNMEVARTDKSNRKQELLKKVGEINKLITDHFYLSQAQEFNYANY